MPEIKNTFNQGKMNKDLDERLIPKGQYRDALNISVATSEGSDVGTVQNIMGNSRVDSLSSGGTCVGSISNELTNKLYTFVKMLDRDVIVEYDKSDAPYSASSFIAVDLSGENAFLKFTGKQVTGINIIDDFLFWTDGDSEPKKINIEETRHKEDPTNINLHSRLYIDGEDKGFLTEDYVTVIKKKPSIAPTYKMNSAIEDVNSAIFEKIFPRFCFRYKYRDGEYSAMGPFTDVVFNSKYDDGISSLNSYSTDEPYNKTMTNVIKSIDLYDFVPSDIPKDVVQVDLLYKQENSNVVYSIDNIKYTDSEWSKAGSGQLATNVLPAGTLSELVTFGEVSAHKGKYNISTESIHAALPENQLLRPWDNVPRSALAQEIVGNRIVYGNYTQGYDFGKDIDGNFLKPNVWSGFELRETQDFSEGGLRSLKSKRDYQVGVVFGDKYGRETPVFTSKKGVKIDWRNPELGLNASNSNMFKAYVDLEPADWIDYYKFYIKETSGEYYNLIMDKAYIPPKHVDFHDDNNHLWLSFASSDRNKIVEEDFITIKKIFNNSLSTQPLFDNKYKVLDISNEAPEAIKYTFSPLGTVANNGDILAGMNHNANGQYEGNEADPSIFLNPDARIDKEDAQDIEINKNRWHYWFGADLRQDFAASGNNNMFISWERHGAHSKRYKISSIKTLEVLQEVSYQIKLSSKISAMDANIAKDVDGNDWLLHENLTFKVERRDEVNGEEFSGKFFVKIKTAVNLLINEDSSLESQNYAVTSQQMYWLYSPPNAGDDGEVSGLINTINPGAPTGSQYPTEIIPGCEPMHWSALFDALDAADKKSFFIDNLPFIASNPSTNSYAKESGEGWYGAQTHYPRLEWKKNIGPWKGVSYDASQTSSLNLALLTHGKEWQGPLFGMSDDLFNYGDNVGDGFENLDLVGGGANLGDWENSQTSDMDYYTWSLPKNAGGRGVTPEVYLAQGDNAGDRIINGLEGIMTSTVEHTSLWRQWNVNTIYPSNLDVDNTYGTSNSDIGKHYMHLSFLGPGEDLIDLSNVTSIVNGLGVTSLVGKDSIASKLQGIWGGGIFNLLPTASQGSGQDSAFPLSLSNTSDIAISPVITSDEADGIRIMEFEGNYDEVTGIGRALTPSELQGQGYDDSYQALHLNQWRPEISPSGLNADVQFFVSQLEEGNRFIFKDDPGKIVYTIQKVRTKHIYNHTSWRMRWIYNGDDYKNADDVNYPLSVEEAASAWADSVTVDASQTITGETAAATGDLIDALENFGARHNRRTCYIIELDKNPTQQGYNPGAPTGISALEVDDDTFTNIEFLHPETNVENVLSTLQSYPAIWETEPQQLTDLNIYYEASNNIPVRLTSENAEIFAPIGCRVVLVDDLGLEIPTLDEGRIPGEAGIFDYNANRRVTNWIVDAGDFDSNQYDVSTANTILSGDEFAAFELNYNFPYDGPGSEQGAANVVGDPVAVKFIRENGSYTTAKIKWFKQFSSPGDFDKRIWIINRDLDLSLDTGLSWYNCFSFGDGIESNRIRDTFNEMQITNGARASSILEEPYAEEHRKHGLIYSGIYNSNSGINNLNQFIQAEKITKDLNPTYGSIQKLFTRSTDLVAMCEDRVLKILANKDAVFNADGNPQLVATENVLGQAVPFVGDYGISKNPESFASESYRAYFTDKQRGSVLRLSMDGLTPISDAGMRDWFRDNLSEYNIALGSYDDYSKHYNLTLDNYPVDTSNLLTSSNVDQGTELVTYQNDVNHFQDSFPLTGVDLIPSPHNINETWQSHYNHWGIPDIPVNHSFIPLKNMSLNSSTTITHHSAIPKGHFVQAVEGQDFVGEAFGEFLQAPIIDTPYDSFNAPYSARFNLNAQEVVADIGAFSLGNNIFIENHGSGTPLMYASRSFTSADGVETIYDGPPDAPASNTLPAFVGSIWRLENQNNDEPGGIAFSPEGSSFLSGAGVGTAIDGGLKYSVNILDSYVDSPITDLTHQVSDDIIASFPEATSKTIFNGEEIAIYFTTGVFNITDPWFQLADGFNMLIELFDGEEPVDPEIIMPLGDTQFGNANYILNNLTDSPYEAHHMLFTDWTGYSNGNPDIAFAGDYVMGWQSNNEVLFPAIWANVPGVYEANDGNPVHGSPTMNSAAWKFSDGTTQDSVLIENLVVKLSLVTKPSAVSTKYSIYVNEFKLVKPHSLINPTGIEGQDFIQEVNPIPYHDIPAWAEVKHGDGSGGILGWTGDVENNGTNLIDFVWTNQIIYGRQNLGQPNTEYEAGGLGEFGAAHTYYSPTINEETGDYNAINEPLQSGGAITNFGDHIDLSDQPVTPLPGEQPDPFVSIHEVSGDNTGGFSIPSTVRIEVDADSTAIISQDISDNPLENGNWYLLDISYQPVTDDIDANSDVSLLNCIPTGLIPESPIDQDSGDPSYPYGYFGEIKPNGNLRLLSTTRTEYDTTAVVSNVIRCIFQYPFGFPPLEEIKIAITKHDYAKAIDSIRLINITNLTTGGKADSWITPPSNYLGSSDVQIPPITYNLLDQPEVYFKNGAIEWNTTQGPGHEKFIYQNISPNFPMNTSASLSNNRPYEFSFTITPASNLDIQGSLAGYVTGNTFEDAEVDGITSISTNGFYFQNLTQPGDYVIKGNMIYYPGISTQVLLNGVEIGYMDGDVVGSIYSASTFAEATPLGNPRKVFFEPEENGFTGAIKDIALRDTTNYFTGGTVDSWNIVFSTSLQNLLFWEEDPAGGGRIRFEGLRAVFGNINQNIGHIHTNQEVRLSFDCALDQGSIAGYYYNEDGKGFVFQTDIEANVFFEQDFFIGTSTNDDPGNLINTVVITSGSNDKALELRGTLDNITLNKIFRLENSTTVSFNEDVRGWESFKSFVPERGVSLSNQYFTVKNGELWQHYTNETRGSFYGEQYEASVTAILNETPSSIKSFNTINYEGSQAMVKAFAKAENSTATTLSTYNAFTNDRLGWEMESFETDLQKGFISEFIEKEGKWFNYIKGSRLSTENIDTANFNFQGLGIVSSTH